MGKLEEMLTQAESQEESNEQWEHLDRYETKEYYTDEHGYTRINNKSIEDVSENISVSGENNSQYIEFRMNRFYDGVDLSEMVISVFYEAEGVGDEGYVINAYRNSEELKFGWVIPSSVTQYHEIQLCIWVRGVLEDGSDYILKTLPKVYTIYPGLNIGGTIPEPEENWYLNFVRVMDSKVFEAKFLEDSCKEMNENVNAKSSQVDEQYLQIQIMHPEALEAAAQAEQYRDEAEQFRNEVFSATPDGYAELQETVASNTAKIDTIIEKAELNIKNSASGENIHLTDSADAKVVGFGLYGKATQNGEPTPDNPIEITVAGSNGSVEVVSCGKNLYNELTLNKEYSYGGVTLTKDAETGNLTISGTATASNNMIMNPLTLPAGTYYYQKGNVTNCGVSLYNQTAKTFISTNKELSFTLTEESVLDVRVQTVTGQSPSGTIKIQIEKGSAMTEYEPYTETTSTIPTPNGLCGIKVSSGGNYTDENGQHWVCDEIVKYADGSGKRIQRVGKAVLNGNEVWNVGSLPNGSPYKRYFIKTVDFESKKLYTPVYCSHFTQYSMNAWYAEAEGIYLNTSDNVVNLDVVSKIQTVEEWKMWLSENTPELYYILATPIITPLTAEEIAEIEKLHTFYPVTNISNDAGCGMTVTYLCDAKNYIDNRLALIETALVNSI